MGHPPWGDLEEGETPGVVIPDHAWHIYDATLSGVFADGAIYWSTSGRKNRFS